mmetsp:Transcript_35051/g.76840  ORF Transcript_35051/g.76840 Transcript_35051/m.76840 type:complete len:84 (-) Transcript_35051:688-939(-)
MLSAAAFDRTTSLYSISLSATSSNRFAVLSADVPTAKRYHAHDSAVPPPLIYDTVTGSWTTSTSTIAHQKTTLSALSSYLLQR